jgi:hypothetical protein
MALPPLPVHVEQVAMLKPLLGLVQLPLVLALVLPAPQPPPPPHLPSEGSVPQLHT